MPTVTRENVGLLNDKITIMVTKEDYLPAFEKAIKQYAKNANIPGFRKGMVPTGMIRKMYGSSVFTDEVLRTVEKSLMDFLQKEQLDIFAQPLPMAENDARILDFNMPDDYTFSFEVGLKPEFQVADLASAGISRYKVVVTDDMVETEVERLRQKAGQLTEPETVTSDEHVLNVGFEASDADGNVTEGTAVKENSLLVKYFREPLRGKLSGMKKGDSLTVQLSEAFDEKEREWVMADLGLDKSDPASAEKFYKMTIAKVGLVVKRDLGEDLYNELYPGKELKTEDDFRNHVRQEIRQQWDSQSNNHLQHELYHYLNEHSSMEFPETFLRRWMKEGQEKPKTDDEVEAEFPTFRNQLRWTLVSDRIVKAQDIQVSREEVMNQLRQQIMGYFGGMSLDGNLDWLDGYVDRMMQDEQQVDGAYRRALTEKIFNWAEAQITPEEKEISAEDFANMLKVHQHEH